MSVGAPDARKYNHAKALIALGQTKAVGSVYQSVGAWNIPYVKTLLDSKTPIYLSWAKELIKCFL